MIKKLKIGFLVAVLSVTIGASQAFATAASLTYSSNTTISIGGYNYVVASGSTATSAVVGASSLVLVVNTGGTFTLSSAAGAILNNTVSSGSAFTPSCSAGASSLVVTGADGVTVTITPFVGTTCASGGAGLSSGNTPPPVVHNPPSSGGNTPPVTLTITNVPLAPATIAGCNGTAGFSTVNGLSCSGNTATVTTTTYTAIPGCGSRTTGFSTTGAGSCAGNTGTVTITTSYNLGTVTLKNGSKGESVKQLQKVLNKILKLGLAEDGKLGPKTIAVIKKWQKDHNLVADGLVGAKTKAAMKAEAESD